MNFLKTGSFLALLSAPLMFIGGETGICLVLAFALRVNHGADWYSDKIGLGQVGGLKP